MYPDDARRAPAIPDPPPRASGTATAILRSLAFPARVLIAAALFGRLAGIGRDWLPPAPVLAGALVAWQAIAAVRRDGVRAWRARLGLDGFALGLLALIALAVLVRVPSLDADLGRQPPDIDGHRLGASVRHFFINGEIKYGTVEHYPGVVYWGIAAFSMLSFLGTILGSGIQDLRQMPVESFMLAARVMNVGVAAGTVALTALLGRRLGGGGAGLIAGGLVAVVPLAIHITTDTRNDPGQVLLLVATVLSALVAISTRAPRWAILAGALAGLATGVKYTSVFALVPAIFAAVATGTGAERLRRAAWAIGAFALAVAVSNHFIWWDFPNFLRQLVSQVAITGPRHWAATDNPAAWHRDLLADIGPGWPLLVLGAAWGAWVLATGRPHGWLFWSFPLLYSWFTTQRPSQFDRWVYPLLPFMAIAGACGLMAVVGWLAARPWWPARGRLRPAAIAAVVVVALAQPIGASVFRLSHRVVPGTGVLLERWLQRSIAPGDVVLVERRWLDLRDARFDVMRVPDLAWALAPARYAISAADWVVVPDLHFGNPSLGRLSLAKAVTADARSFGGNAGHDYRVYATPKLEPVARVDVELDDPSAATMLGWDWDGRTDDRPGRLLPDRGARLFVPPLAPAEATLEIDVANAGRPHAAVPFELTFAGRTVALSDGAGPEPGTRRLSARVRPPQRPRAIEIVLTPLKHQARIRVLRVQLSHPAGG